MIALIAAVSKETSILRDHLPEAVTIGPFEGFQGSIGEKDVLLAHSGIGKSAAAAIAALLAEFHRPELIISFGCGGAYPEARLNIGDLAIATSEIFGDEGVLSPGGFLTLEDIGFPSVERGGARYFNTFPVDCAALELISPQIEAFAVTQSRQVLQGAFVTVSTCCGTSEAGKTMVRRTGGICENMEGGAVAQVCALYGIPFLELRGISNLVEDRDPSQWDLPSAARIVQEALLRVIPLLPET